MKAGHDHYLDGSMPVLIFLNVFKGISLTGSKVLFSSSFLSALPVRHWKFFVVEAIFNDHYLS